MKSNWDNLGPPHVLRPDQVEPSVQFMKPWDIGYVAQEYVVAKTDLSMWVYKAARLYADKEVDPLASDDLYRLVRTDSDLVLEVVEGALQVGEGLNRLVETDPYVEREPGLFLPITRLIETDVQLAEFRAELFQADHGFVLNKSALARRDLYLEDGEHDGSEPQD